MILTFILIIVVLLLWGNNRAKQKAARERMAYYDKRHKRIKAIDDKRKRQDRIWSVLFHINQYKETYINGDKRKATEKNYLSSIEAVKEHQPTADDIKTAIRFCKIEHANHRCDHFITPEEEQKIYKIIETQKKE